MKDIRGFTLVELVIALAVVTLMLAMGVPSFSDYNRAQKVKSAATAIHVQMQKARMEAIKRNNNVGLELVAGSPNQLRLFEDNDGDNDYGDGDNNGVRNVGEPTLLTVNLEDDILFNTNAGGAGPDGDPIPAAANEGVTFPGSHPVRTLVYAPNGAVFTNGGTVYDGAVYLKLTEDDSVPDIPEYAVTVGQFGAIQLYRFDGATWQEK